MRVKEGVPKIERNENYDCMHGDTGKGALIGVGKNAAAAGKKRAGSGGVEDAASEEDDDDEDD